MARGRWARLLLEAVLITQVVVQRKWPYLVVLARLELRNSHLWPIAWTRMSVRIAGR